MTRRHARARRGLLLGSLLVLSLVAPSALSALEGPADGRLDQARLNGVVEKSIARLAEKGARWTAILEKKQQGGEVWVEVVQFGGLRRCTLSARTGQEHIELLQVIERDGSWYVKEKQGVFGKYRPCEAPFFLSTAPLFLERAELLLAGEDLGSFGKLEGVENGVAVFRQPVADEVRERLEQWMLQLDAVAREHPLPADVQAQQKATRDLVEHGLPIEVDLSTGIITKFGTLELMTRIQDFAWLDSVPEDTFALQEEYPDFTSDPTTGDLDECVMIGHCGIWQPTMREASDTDVRLLNLKTGELRRIPFRGPAAITGCFLKDRKRVVVCGMLTGRAGCGLFEIDLSSGGNRALTTGALAQDFCANPCVSPDGKLVAFRRVPILNPTLPSEIYVVDLESGDTRKIGQIVGGLHLSWLPDGRRLLMMREEFPDWNTPSEGTICTMALDGTVEDICPGEWPVLIGDSKIMFTPRTGRVWHTCNLDGSDVRILADGLREYGFPTVSPDGTRLLMMHFGTPRGPRPTIIKIGHSQGREAVSIGGLWALPAWR